MKINSYPLHLRSIVSVAVCLAVTILAMPAQAASIGVVPSTGWIPSTRDQLAQSVRINITGRALARPRRMTLVKWLPPVEDQGPQHSCVPWALAYYGYTCTVSRRLHWPPEQSDHYRFSPAFLYHVCNNGRDGGVSFYDAVTALKSSGCATWADMPYNAEDYSSTPGSIARRRAERFRARRAGWMFSDYGGRAVPRAPRRLDVLRLWRRPGQTQDAACRDAAAVLYRV
ncbi:MAG: hypothetical protein ACLQVD_19585 [Capsulimonadaceae bacterium]